MEGPLYITIENAVKLMKCDRVAVTSLIAAEMLKASGVGGATSQGYHSLWEKSLLSGR